MAKLGLINPDALFHERYRIVRCIKAGGMGAVYEVLDERTNSRRALKAMLPGVVDDADLRARFELEARVTGTIESDHIVRVSDVGIDEATGTPFMVMDLLRGRDLGYVVDKVTPLSREDVVLYLTQAALALDKTHAAGIVHRDLKPENLFITSRDDGSRCLKILDFGIAKVLERRTHAKSTRTIGTPAYMAPEQIRGESTIGPAADIYALGHIAYALLVGIDYWAEESSQISSTFGFFSRVLLGMSEEPSTRARRMRGVELPAAFDVWLFRAAAAQPEDRYASASACVVALADALSLPPPPALAHVPLPDPVLARVSSAPTVSHSAPTLPEPSGPIAVVPPSPPPPPPAPAVGEREAEAAHRAQATTVGEDERSRVRMDPLAFPVSPEPPPAELASIPRTPHATSAPVTLGRRAISQPESGPVAMHEPEIELPLRRGMGRFAAAVGAAIVGAALSFWLLGSTSPKRAGAAGVSAPMALSASSPVTPVASVTRALDEAPKPDVAPVVPSAAGSASAAPTSGASAAPVASSTASARSAPRVAPKAPPAPKPSSQPHGLM